MSRPTDPNKDRLFWIDYETTGIDMQDLDTVPIQVGVIVTDTKLNELDRYESLIWFDEFNDYETWEEYSKAATLAFQIHGIYTKTCLEEGKSAAIVAKDLIDLATKHKVDGGRIILVSDNIQFEWQLTDILLREMVEHDWPWHYCGWDTSILELVPELNFRDPEDPPHSALQDVEGLLKAARDAGIGK
jgi:oligoribonuclease (3'-5' exoribonuclease)